MSRRNGILNWFKFESRAKREKRERAYYGRMFPFGKEQNDWEVKILTELYPDKKRRVQELHFALLTLRENLLNTELDEENDDYMTPQEAFDDWVHCDITRQLVRQGIAPVIYAVADLENKADTLEAMPVKEQILAAAEEAKSLFGKVSK